jgi:hypothetical protein
VLGGIVPLVHSAAPGLIASDWGFVLLAGGAGCILVDRVFGYSSSWTRFSRTGLALQYTLARAQTEWLSALLSCSDQPSEEESAALLSVIRRLYAEVQQIMEEETATWIGYLTESLEELAFTTAHSNSLPAQSDSAPRLPIKTGQASRSSAVDSGEAEAS